MIKDRTLFTMVLLSFILSISRAAFAADHGWPKPGLPVVKCSRAGCITAFSFLRTNEDIGLTFIATPHPDFVYFALGIPLSPEA
jgi:hypothetical protein